MDMDDLSSILALFERNVNKLQSNLTAYQVEVDTVRRTLEQSWSHVDRSDGRIISLHDGLLSSVNAVNEYMIKLNLHINLNRSIDILKNEDTKPTKHYNKENNTNLDSIELDVHSANAKLDDQPEGCALQLITPKNCSIKSNQFMYDMPTSSTPIFAPIVLPIPPRQSKLLAPKGGRQMSANETYDQLYKNIGSFVKSSVVQVTVMHLNIAENCIFVAKWAEESMPVKMLLAGQMTVQMLDQLPNFGEVFAVYDAQERIIPRVVINSHAEGGGYDAYLLDYGEHIHLDDEEIIFAIPNEVKLLPAEAIRCHVRNREVASMCKFTYKKVHLRVLVNSGNDLEVEFLDDGSPEIRTSSSIHCVSPDCAGKANSNEEKPNIHSDSELHKSIEKLSPEDLKMLEAVDCGTSNALKAVLGYIPKDDQRICRHYDPKLKGCFKGTQASADGMAIEYRLLDY